MRHLTPENRDRFQDASIVERYHLRLPYPPETFDVLASLIPNTPRTLLDIGTGTGDIARALVPVVDRVDAVDLSERMLERAKRLPNGEKVNWILGAVESVGLNPPYGLIVAGDSLHWMNWQVVFPRFAALSNGLLAIVTRHELPTAWQEALGALIRRYSTFQNYQPYDLIAAVDGLFEKVGEHRTAAVMNRQTVEDYIQSFHSRSSLSLAAMSPEASAAFDDELRAMVLPQCQAGYLVLQTEALLVWGRAI